MLNIQRALSLFYNLAKAPKDETRMRIMPSPNVPMRATDGSLSTMEDFGI